MFDFIADYYEIIKAIHVIAVISWMAGLLYLPRLFVNHAMNIDNQAICAVFRPMERKLMKLIMIPAMSLTWICGILLVLMPNLIDFKIDFWFHVKFLCVVLLSVYHVYLAIEVEKFITGEGIKTHKFYRLINEIPTILMIIIVVMVIVRPF
ncbi:MAG: protoporphyrinogen oxidase HemJ [Rhizobiales bacterium]|nr:protoporphyrinogen oxidase HemJ [Hyphomicrobiales bacterium]NRB15195.1 protoporphyrinogen oxidase HemJ [Hyphomicrobiales bacterium]